MCLCVCVCDADVGVGGGTEGGATEESQVWDLNGCGAGGSEEKSRLRRAGAEAEVASGPPGVAELWFLPV